MEINELSEKNRILKKLTNFLHINVYYDLHELSSDKFMEKYGYWGDSFNNHSELRFYNETNAISQLKKLLLPGVQYYFFPIDGKRTIHKIKPDELDAYYGDNHLKSHFIIADNKLTWLIIKNDFNKLIGMGDFIKKRMGKMISLKFDGAKLMYSLTSKKK